MSKKIIDAKIILDYVNTYIYKNNDLNKINIETIYKIFKNYFKINKHDKTNFINVLNENYNCTPKYIILREEEENEEKQNNKVVMVNSEWLDIINEIKKNNLIISTI